jgi:hypothetical protein
MGCWLSRRQVEELTRALQQAIDHFKTERDQELNELKTEYEAKLFGRREELGIIKIEANKLIQTNWVQTNQLKERDQLIQRLTETQKRMQKSVLRLSSRRQLFIKPTLKRRNSV